MKDECGDILQTMHKLGNDAEDCISLLQAAFIYNSSKNLHDCRMKIDIIKCTVPHLIDRITELARKDNNLKPYVSVPVHLIGIGEGIEKLSELMDRKIRGGILFSDRAITEITFLLQRLVDILRPASDIILARNEILNRYIQESGANIEKRAIEYATLHEERLIEGLCLPAASPLYISMIDEIKNIAWHAREIAVNLV